MRKLCIVHFLELEKFPPAINFARFLAKATDGKASIELLTTLPVSGDSVSIPGIRIHRLAKWRSGMNRMSRGFLYTRFNIAALIFLIRSQPEAVLYYETISSFAPLIYKKLFKRKTRLFIHYHEYTSLPEYKNGMVLNRWLHQLELKSYSSSTWVSQTNEDRMNLFLADVTNHAPSFTCVLPNFPPASWTTAPRLKSNNEIKFVYVGALSMHTMYVEDMARFVINQSGKCSWDIYSSNLSASVTDYLKSLNCKYISFKGSVPYDQLPTILSQYDVGLVLYKGHIPNYIFNVPNKLFEYHVCGLDVWFPASMISSVPLTTKGTFPQIIPVDFQNLNAIDITELLDRTHLIWKRNEFVCEKVFGPLVSKMMNEGSDLV